jgi:hypothetical protein
MPNQCPFPVRSTDSRRCYRAGGVPGCTLGLALIAALLGYAGFSHAMPVAQQADIRTAPISLHADAGRTQAAQRAL